MRCLMSVYVRAERCRGADHSRRSAHRLCCRAEQSTCAAKLLAVFSLGISRHECPYRLLWLWQGNCTSFTFTFTFTLTSSEPMVKRCSCVDNIDSCGFCHHSVFTRLLEPLHQWTLSCELSWVSAAWRPTQHIISHYSDEDF